MCGVMSFILQIVRLFFLASWSVLVCADELDRHKNLVVVDGHLLTYVSIEVLEFKKVGYMVVDLDYQGHLGLSESTYRQALNHLSYGSHLKVEGVGVNLDLDSRELEKTSDGSVDLEYLTQRYGATLGDLEVIAVAGYPLLKEHVVNFNIAEGKFSLSPSSVDYSREIRDQAGSLFENLSVTESGVFIEVSSNGCSLGHMRIQTSGSHTVISPKAMTQVDEDSGVSFGVEGCQSLSDFIALRTKEINERGREAADKVALLSGLQLWTAFDVTLDFQERFLALTPTRHVGHSEADAEFYKASFKKSWDDLHKYLHDFPKDRNVNEAVDEMFRIGLKENIDAKRHLSSFQVALEQMLPQYRSTYLLDYCKQANDAMPSSRYSELTIDLCEMGLDYISYSQTPSIRQDYQLILGERSLDVGDHLNGWKYYLSASFNGDPKKNGVTRMGLGRSYELMKRYRRAYASYKRAAEGATRSQIRNLGLDIALKRVAQHLAPNDPLLVEKD